MKYLQWKNLLLVAYLQCLNVRGKCFSVKMGIQKFSKLIEISCWQVMKSKLTIIR